MTAARGFELYTLVCSRLARWSLMICVVLLAGIVLSVQWQVIGRYVFNDSPTWTEELALLLVLYLTSLAVAVGVRDAGHIGLESLATLLPLSWQRWLAMFVHSLVAVFGVLMAHAGWLWASLKLHERKPMFPVPEAVDYVPLVIAGVLIFIFCIEHIIALLRGNIVESAWS